MSMFPDASDEFWRSHLAHMPQDEVHTGIAVEDMSHELLGVLSEIPRRSQDRWPTANKAACRGQVSEVWKSSNGRRRIANQDNIPEFAVRKYVSAARVRKRGVVPEIVGTWIGICQMETAGKQHLYDLHGVVSEKLGVLCPARMRPYVDQAMSV